MKEEFNIFGDELVKYEGTNTHVIVPETITVIRDFAFYGCESLENITLPNTITSIGSFAFYGCSNLKVINIPESVTLIGGGAFSYCKSLETVYIPDSIKSISKSVFYRCLQLKTVHLPDSIKSIDHSAFGFCSSLESIQLPESLINIGDNGFEECQSLKTIIMPTSLETIGKKVFFNCVNLNKILVSTNLKQVGDSAFETHSTLSLESNDSLFLKAAMFDSRWNLSFRMKNEETYKFVNCYLPNIDFKKWKADAQIILLVNFLETYSMYHSEQRDQYYQNCMDYKTELLEFLVNEKRYTPLNQALEIGLINSTDLEPYFNRVNDREQKAKIMEFKNKEIESESIMSELENELMNMF